MKKPVTKKLRLIKSARLEVSFRPYRSTKAGRIGKSGKNNSKLVIPTYLLLTPTKEVSLSYVKPKTGNIKAAKTNSRARTWGKAVQRQAVLPYILILVGFGGVVYFAKSAKPPEASIRPATTFSVPIPKESLRDPLDNGLSRSEPTHIVVKSANVDAPVDPVGQKKDKSMETPPLFENVTGWYKLGPSPGEVGPSVIVGHVDTYKGPSVFYGLKDLKAGDKIVVTRKDGKKVTFKVTGLEQFQQNNFPTDKVYGNIDYAGLRLITCGGTFNQQTGRYTANTVVFAKMVKS